MSSGPFYRVGPASGLADRRIAAMVPRGARRGEKFFQPLRHRRGLNTNASPA